MDAAFCHGNYVFVSSSSGLFDWAGEERMNQTRKIFEAVMRGQGYKPSDLVLGPNGRYVKPSVQTRWRYFLSGWEMASAFGGEP